MGHGWIQTSINCDSEHTMSSRVNSFRDKSPMHHGTSSLGHHRGLYSDRMKRPEKRRKERSRSPQRYKRRSTSHGPSDRQGAGSTDRELRSRADSARNRMDGSGMMGANVLGAHRRVDRYGPRSQEHKDSSTEEEIIMSFKEFMLTCNEDLDPFAASQKYSKYKEEVECQIAERFFNDNKESGFLYDTYHPVAIRKNFMLRKATCQRHAVYFFELLQNGSLNGVKFVAPKQSDEDYEAPSTQTPSKFEIRRSDVSMGSDPFFISDPSVNALRLNRIPISVGSGDILSLFDDVSQIQDITLLPPKSDESYRDGWLQFISAEACSKAAVKLDRKVIKESYVLQPILDSPPEIYIATAVPAVMCRQSRVECDIEKCKKLIEKFDSEWGITDLIRESPNYGCQHPLLDREWDQNPTLYLDLLMLYLRRVHNVSYYFGRRFNSERAEWETCGPLVVRPYIPDSISKNRQDEAFGDEEEEKSNSWVVRLDKKIDDLFQSTFQCPEPVADDSRVEQLWKDFCEQNCANNEPGKWNCRQCTKIFKAATFVFKHLRNKHSHFYHSIVKSVSLEVMHDLYIKDPDKYIPCRPSANLRSDSRYRYPIRKPRMEFNSSNYSSATRSENVGMPTSSRHYVPNRESVDRFESRYQMNDSGQSARHGSRYSPYPAHFPANRNDNASQMTNQSYSKRHQFNEAAGSHVREKGSILQVNRNHFAKSMKPYFDLDAQDQDGVNKTTAASEAFNGDLRSCIDYSDLGLKSPPPLIDD